MGVCSTGGAVMANDWLTPLQSDFLRCFFAASSGQDFFLIGETALAALFEWSHSMPLKISA